MEGNLTKGPIMKTLVKLAVPIMASAFLGTLYNITDMAWIGLLGSKAVAGVGVGWPPTNSILGIPICSVESFVHQSVSAFSSCGGQGSP